MYKSNNSDVSLNAQRRTNTNIASYNSNSNNNISVQSNQQNSVNRIAGLLNSSSSHIGNQGRHATNPVVSVVSSSMDLFGPTETNGPQMMNSIDTGISNRPSTYSVLTNLNAPGIASDISKYGAMSTHYAASAKSKKAEQGSGTKPKRVKRPIDANNNNDKSPKKPKQSGVKVTGEQKGNLSNIHSDTDMNASDMSFERAAVVAALTTLYGATNEKPTSQLATNSHTAASLDGNSLPMPLPKQLKHSGSKLTSGMNSNGTREATSIKPTNEITLLKASAANLAAGPSQRDSSKMMSGTTDNGAIKMGAQSSKKKTGKSNESPTISRKSTVTQYPTQYDVLLGRGKSNKNHPGNVWFQDYIQANRDRYFNAPTNVQKRQITMEILETIRKKGRFLRRGAQGWVDVSTIDVQQKVAHALQYRRRCELREHTSPDSNDPQQSSTISHPPHRTGDESESGKKLQSSNNFDASAIALSIVNTAGNFAMARLDAQTRQEQYKVNQEYYQSYLNNLQRPNVDANRNDARVGYGGGDVNIDDRIANSLQLSQHSLYSLPMSQSQRINRPGSMQSNIAAALPDASSSSAMSNALLRRLANTDYRNNAVMNGTTVISGMNPTSAYIFDAGSTTDEQQSSPPSSENLDSSGLHSLADVITQLCSTEGTDEAYPRGYTRG